MAKVEIKMPEDFLLRLSRLADKTDEIIPRVLEAGGEVVLSKTNLQSVIGSGTKYDSRSTGELEAALGLWLMPIGLFLDLWACHKQFLGMESQNRPFSLTISSRRGFER